MADKDKQQEIFDSANLYKDYFSEDEKSLDELLVKLKDLQEIANTQIQTMVNAAPGRGVQHNLIEHMTNAISIASQFQSVLKDKRDIKARSLDLAIKTNKEEATSSDMDEVIANMQKIIKEHKENEIKNIENLTEKVEDSVQQSDSELDKEIEKKLGLD